MSITCKYKDGPLTTKVPQRGLRLNYGFWNTQRITKQKFRVIDGFAIA